MLGIDGIVSGLNTTEIIQGLTAFHTESIRRLEAAVVAHTEKKTAFGVLSANLIGLQTKVGALSRSSSFRPVEVSSSNETVLAAHGSSSLAPGTYRFKVHQLAQSEQYTSSGFASAATPIGAGTLSIETGEGYVDRTTDLDLLNGGRGVRRGSIRITNRNGEQTVVDLSSVVNVNEVVDAINGSGSINVTARLATIGDTNPRTALVLEDSSGGSGNLRVEEVGGGSTARDLGIRASVAADTLEGSSVLELRGGFALNLLNDGLGVRVRTGADLTITTRDGNSFNVDLGEANTLEGVLDAINNHQDNVSVTVAISGSRLVATDASSGATAFSIANFSSGLATSSTATDLGLDTAAAGDTVTGSRILADFNSVLLRNLNGGLSGGGGVDANSIRITNRAGASETIDLSGAETLREAIDLINQNSLSVSASVDGGALGLSLRDDSGGSGLLRVEEESTGTTAADLGILEADGVSDDVLAGSDLNLQYINENTLLSSLNGGDGVLGGSIRITAGNGASFTVDLSQETTVGAVIQDINNAAGNPGVTATINARGDGILLTSTSGGSARLRVDEVDGGTTARDLNLLGVATEENPAELDGSYQREIVIGEDDTLSSVAEAINALGLGVRASIVNDGSLINPVRLQLTGTETGSRARVLLNATGGTALAFNRTSAAKDAIVFFGTAGETSQPVVARSQTNTFSEIVSGLTITTRNTSATDIVITATQNVEDVKSSIEEFVGAYNELVDKIRELTRFDGELEVRGTLFGESVMRTIERQLSNSVTRRITSLPSGQNLAANLGVRVSFDGKLEFRSSDFDALAASDPDAIERIFTKQRELAFDTRLADFRNGQGIDTNDVDAFSVTTRDGNSFAVNLQGSLTVRDVQRAIERASRTDELDAESATVSVGLAADGRSLVLTDRTSGGETFKVAANNSAVASQLGLSRSADVEGGGTITGADIDLTSDDGVALRLLETLGHILDAEGGALTLRSDFYQDRIEETQRRIETKKEVLSVREANLKRQFSQLEVLFSENQNALARLNSAVGSLSSL